MLQTTNKNMSGYARSGKARKKIMAVGAAGFTLAMSCNFASAFSYGDGWMGAPVGTGLPEGTVYDILSNFLFWALAIFGILAVLSFIISGVMYVTAAGDTTRVGNATKAMTWSVVGIIVALAGVIIIQTVESFLGGTL